MNLEPGKRAAESDACAHCGLPVPLARRHDAAPGGRGFCCYGCRLADALAKPGPDAPADRAALSLVGTGQGTLLLRLGLGVFLAMNIMIFSGFFYSQQVYQHDAAAAVPVPAALAAFFAYLLMLLTTLVLVLLGVPLARDATAQWLGAGRFGLAINANLLIIIGVSAAFGVSVYNTVRPEANGYALYFDTASMILVLVTLGSYLDSRAKFSATQAVESFFARLPAKAFVQLSEGVYREVDAADVRPAQIVRVRQGELVPVDGEIVWGGTNVNESALTGESVPREAGVGDRVFAGSINLTGVIHVCTNAAGSDRVAEQVRTLLARARLMQPPIQRLADRIARVFVPAVLLIAAGVFVVGVVHKQPLVGLFNALSVLLISCPCALGLSAPLAAWSALSRAAERGVLFSSGMTLERAAGITHIFFDKTGTLAADRLDVVGVTVYPRDEHFTPADALAIAAAIEETSLHPIARAIVYEARRRNLPPRSAVEATTLPGLGVRAVVDGRQYHLGGPRMLAELNITHPPDNTSPTPRFFLMYEGAVVGEFELAERLRPDAALAISQLRELGVHVEVLTGDRPGPAAMLARSLHVDVHDSLLPADKLAHLACLRASLPPGSRIAMVGDGLNDAPTLAAADVGFVIGNATDLARHSANVHILGAQLTRVPLAIAVARHALRRIRFNLAWSFGYNLIGITLAASGLLSPLFAASAMIISSLVVVASAKNAGRIPQVESLPDRPHVVEEPHTALLLR